MCKKECVKNNPGKNIERLSGQLYILNSPVCVNTHGPKSFNSPQRGSNVCTFFSNLLYNFLKRNNKLRELKPAKQKIFQNLLPTLYFFIWLLQVRMWIKNKRQNKSSLLTRANRKVKARSLSTRRSQFCNFVSVNLHSVTLQLFSSLVIYTHCDNKRLLLTYVYDVSYTHTQCHQSSRRGTGV